MTIKTITSTIQPYLYAGAIRVGVTDAIALVREQVLARVPAEATEQAVAFLRTPIGDALLRLSVSGILAPMSLPQIGQDVRQELLISSSSSGITALQEAAMGLVEAVAGKVPSPEAT